MQSTLKINKNLRGEVRQSEEQRHTHTAGGDEQGREGNVLRDVAREDDTVRW